MTSFERIRYCGYRGKYRLGYTVSSKGTAQLWNVQDIATGNDVTQDIDRWDWTLFERYCNEIYHYGVA